MIDKKNSEESIRSIRKQAETIVKANVTEMSTRLKTLSLEEAEELVHEFEVHQIELKIQNEELLQTQLELESMKNRYLDLYEMAPVGYLTLDEEGLILEANHTVSNLFGMARETLIHQPITHFIFKEDQDIYYHYRKKFFKSDKQHSCELRMMKSDGAMFWAHLSATSGQKTNNSVVFRLVLSDISKRKIAEEELRIAAVAFESQNGAVIMDPEGIILRVNSAFTRLSGYGAEEAIGQTMALFKSGRHDALFYQNIWDTIRKKGHWQGEIWNKHKNEQIYAELLTITAIYSPKGELTHCVANFSDIAEDKEAEAEIHRLAYYDLLTDLANRRLLEDRLKQAIATAKRNEHYGAIFFIDLDKFKILNDTWGHDIGDLLLKEVAQRFKEVVREYDTVARLGGDEFVVLLENLSININEAAALAKQISKKLLEATSRPFFLNKYEYHCNLCIGISIFNKHATVKDIFKQADLALYQAKDAGHNMVRFFDPDMQVMLDLRNTMEVELHEAIRDDQLRLYYQPQVDITQRVVGVEALLRWQHPKYGLIAPDDFISLAEETGLILPIGLWVLETTCTLIKIWEGNLYTRELQVGVNIGAYEFRQPDFVTKLQRVFEKSGINPARLKLELTEGIILENINNTIEKMQAIRQLGVSFSMDDFGTGYSSLSYLSQLPFDQLKIDKFFVSALPDKGSKEAIARTIIAVGRELGMDIIAEGVETKAQLEFLNLHGCHAYQGYLFSRPLSIEKLEVYLQLNR